MACCRILHEITPLQGATMSPLRNILHAILDPHMNRYHKTSLHFLVLHQPGERRYQFEAKLLYYISPVLILCTLIDWFLNPHQSLVPTLGTIFNISTGLYAFSVATEQWNESRSQNLSETGWTQLYRLLIDFRHNTELARVSWTPG